MPSAFGSIAGAVVGGLLDDGDSGGGAGTTTATKEPWAAAAPWLKDNLATGQALQSQYAANPFNQQQLAALGNMGNQTSYMNTLIPDLLGQISGQQNGFNRSAPNARPASYNFGTAGNQSVNAGLLAMLAQRQQTAPATTTARLGYTIPQATMAAAPAPAPAPAPVPQWFEGDYRQGSN